MKRILAAVLILCILPVVSIAEEYEFVYNIIKYILEDYKSAPLPETYYSTANDDGTENRYFFISDDTRIVIKTNGKTTHNVFAVCSNEAETRDFLVACVGCLAAFNVTDASSIFYSYLFAKRGDSTPEFFGGKVYAEMKYYPDKNQYIFFVMEVNKDAP